jgi:hypothetical protein
MRILILVLSLSMVVASGAAHAQSDAGGSPTAPAAQTVPPPAKTVPPASVTSETTPTTLSEIRERRSEWLAQCLRSWDAGTAMTKQEWERTCRRVTDDRVQFLTKQVKEKKVP